MMKTLYILNNPDLLIQCQNAMSHDDGLLLIENAVILANSQTAQDNYFVLEEDLIARGLTPDSTWTQQNYQDFVNLTLNFDKTISWL